MRNYFMGALALGLLSSCQKTEKSEVLYFDSLIQVQSKYLSERKSTLYKTVSLNGKGSTIQLTPDEEGWKREFDIFQSLSMFDRPAYRRSYELRDHIKDTGSNLTIREFVTKEKIPVRELRFYYLQTPSGIKKIEALYEEENLLHRSIRKIILEFDDLDHQSIISGYRIDGGQKTWMSDTLTYSINSGISAKK
jgi:hypothetical protein